LFTRQIVIAALAVVASAVPASASISYVTTLSAFSAVNASALPESFDPLTLNSNYLTVTTVDGFVFSSTSTYSGGNLTALANPGGSWPPSPDVLAQAGTNANGFFVITLPANVFGFGMYASFTLANPDDVQVTVNSGGAFNFVGLNAHPTAPVFLGFRSDQAITSITLSKPGTSPTFGGNIQVNGILFDTVSGSDTGGGGGGTPEPGPFFLIGTGLALLPLLHQRISRRT
jgi:hypothetical protein